jgi:hypothetical protein
MKTVRAKLFGFGVLVGACVFSASALTDTNALPALAPPDAEMPTTFWEKYGLWVVAIAIGLVLLLLLALWKSLERKPPVLAPPADTARAALGALPIGREDAALLGQVAQILRVYFINGFKISPAELTTAEFGNALARHNKIGAELAGEVSAFLRQCDERKFSTLPDAAPLQAVARARELITLAEAHRTSQPTTGLSQS